MPSATPALARRHGAGEPRRLRGGAPANFAVVVDPDPERRDQFVAAAAPRLHLLPGLVSGACRSGDFHTVWAAVPGAPIAAVADRDGAAIVVGTAIVPDADARVTPAEVRRAWQAEAPPAAWRTWDGYFAAVVFDPQRGTVAGADLLGLFPVYHWSDGEVLLVASSPETFRYRPAFRRAFDPAALVGITLANGLFRGRTLWAGVRRLSAAHFLRFRRGADATEQGDAEVTASLSRRTGSDLSFADQLDMVDAAFSGAARRQVAGEEPCWILLSGGLDSRLVAGYLHRQHPPLVGPTLGVPSDIEMTCARAVVRELGIERRTGSVPAELFPVFAETLTSRWEHLANGGEAVFNRGTRALMVSFPTTVSSGIVLDWLIGGSYNFGVEPGRLTFERGFASKINSRGFPPPLLQRLLRRESSPRCGAVPGPAQGPVRRRGSRRDPPASRPAGAVPQRPHHRGEPPRAAAGPHVLAQRPAVGRAGRHVGAAIRP